MNRPSKPSTGLPATLAHLPTPALRDAVAQAYATFRQRGPLTAPLDVCLGCCCPVEIERELREWPLAQLTTQHFYEYNTAAKGLTQPLAEVRRLLPRLLELVAAGEEVHHSTELYLCRLGRCPEDAWSAQERLVLDRFAAAYFDAVLRSGASGGALQIGFDDPLSVLLMFDIGGIAVDPLLELWLRCEDPGSTIQFVDSTSMWFWDEHEVGNAFAEDRPDFRARLREWLLDPSTRACFAAKMREPAFLERADLEPAGRAPFDVMVTEVLAHLTR